MKCARCKSHRVLRFVDGFGQKRVFCRSCGRSYLEAVDFVKVPSEEQRTMLGHNLGFYFRPGVLAPMSSR
jgi:hypothetical protein